jgi:DMSO/TMAO reductase YedYZ molybdopterin-dependent catalytic subunit
MSSMLPPLPPEHGFPARLVVPGFYGTNSVKWLNRITLARSRHQRVHDALVQ